MKLRIKEIMIDKGVSSIDLASMIGVSRVTISNLINNKTMPSIDTLSKISNSLDVPIWQFFTSPTEIQTPKCNTITCPHCGGDIKIVGIPV